MLPSADAYGMDDAMMQKLKQDLQTKHDEALNKMAQEFRTLQVQRSVERDNLNLLKQQLGGAEEQHKLRSEQYKARFTVQQERVGDLEQQLLSLYTAFELLRSERATEEEARKALRSNLNDADAEVARQVDAGEQQQGRSGGNGAAARTTASSSTGSRVTPPHTIVIDTPTNSTSRGGFETPGTLSSPTSYQANNSSLAASERIMQGVLLKRSPHMRSWKKKHSTLSLAFTHYRWDFVSGVDGKGKMFGLQVGVSKVEKYLKYPFAFCVHVNPYDSSAPVVHAAARNKEEYHQWMAALTRATTGEDNYHEVQQSPRSPVSHISFETPNSNPSPSSPRRSGRRSVSDREQSDLERAIALSTQVV